MKNNFDLKGYMKENKTGAYQQLNEMWYSDMQAIGQPMGMRHTAINEEEEAIEEMGGVKTVGDKGKMATPNSRPNLGRHRSSDMLDKMSKKDHDKNTVVGAKAAAYKAPHMKEAETNGHIIVTIDYNTDPDDIAYVSNILKKAEINGKVKAGWNDEEVEIKINPADKKKLVKALFKNGFESRIEGEDNLQEEEINEAEQDDDVFAGSDTEDFKDYSNSNFSWNTNIAGQTVEGWTAEESQGGAISWQNPKYPHTIVYATPGWEGVNGIAFEVYSEAEDGMMDEPMMQKVIGAGTDLWKTEKGYLALMDKAFTALEMKLTPSVDMEDMNEDEDPFGAIKTGIDKITQGDDEDTDMDYDNRFDQLGGDKIKAGIESLMADGFDFREILQFVKDAIASKRNY